MNILTLVTIPLLVAFGAALLRDLPPVWYWLATALVTGAAFATAVVRVHYEQGWLDDVHLLFIGAHTMLPCVVLFVSQRQVAARRLEGLARLLLAVGIYVGVLAATVVFRLMYSFSQAL